MSRSTLNPLVGKLLTKHGTSQRAGHQLEVNAKAARLFLRKLLQQR